MAGWHEPLDFYCERLDATFWAEPFNALTNAAFLVAASAGLRLWRASGARDVAVPALVAMVAVIGIGGFLFHTFAVRWSLFADTIPIAIFIHGYFFLALRRFFGLGPRAALAGVGAFLVASAAIGWAGQGLANGSLGYLPALLGLLGSAIGLKWWAFRAHVAAGGSAHPGALELFHARAITSHWLTGAAVVFTISLILRTADLPLCERFPNGLHGFWHLLNALVLVLALAAAIRHGPEGAAVKPAGAPARIDIEAPGATTP